MGAPEVRDALVAWFDAPAINGLVKVYPALAVYTDGQRWEFAPGQTWAAVGFIHLSTQEEKRIGDGGAHGGIKQVTHACDLVLLYQYVIPDPIPVESDQSEWVGPLDQLIEDVANRIRADRTAGTAPAGGTGGVIWQFGEGDGMDSPDIRIVRDLPEQDNGVLHNWQRVEFTVVEMITS